MKVSAYFLMYLLMASSNHLNLTDPADNVENVPTYILDNMILIVICDDTRVTPTLEHRQGTQIDSWNGYWTHFS